MKNWLNFFNVCVKRESITVLHTVVWKYSGCCPFLFSLYSLPKCMKTIYIMNYTE